MSTILADSSLAEGFRYLMLTCIGRDAATEVAPTFSSERVVHVERAVAIEISKAVVAKRRSDERIRRLISSAQ